ncbi:hypothetical protein ATI53_1001229 [Salipiger aestuarii]|uniref:Uncharacterized protein n=1 Tax=Salipiger aestuarii TaxID=568098 RepID=A0A327YU17_9RHOB|nr:hypothetical protein ATI53_1001229 [Salipiger aestuarii]
MPGDARDRAARSGPYHSAAMKGRDVPNTSVCFQRVGVVPGAHLWAGERRQKDVSTSRRVSRPAHQN